MNIDLYPLAWQAVAKLIAQALEHNTLDSQTRLYLRDALVEMTDALADEAEEQYFGRKPD